MASVEVSLEQEDHLVEDQETSVTCRVEGGQPRPEIGFMLMADEQTKIEVRSPLIVITGMDWDTVLGC